MSSFEERTVEIIAKLEMLGNASISGLFEMELKYALCTGSLEKCLTDWEERLALDALRRE